jgi:hypothetical protein
MLVKDGMAIEVSMASMAITTTTSISEKPKIGLALDRNKKWPCRKPPLLKAGFLRVAIL